MKSALETILVFVIGFVVLGAKELYLQHSLLIIITCIIATSIGLLINLIPFYRTKYANQLILLILMLQVIFGGALLAFERMNKDLVYFDNSPIPAFSQFMPSRWSFESAVLLQFSQNRFDTTRDSIANARKTRTRDFTTNKNNLISQGINPDQAETQLNHEIQILENRFDLHKSRFESGYGNKAIRASILVTEYEEQNTLFYPLFTKQKLLPITNSMLPTYIYNSIILLFASFCIVILSLLLADNYHKKLKNLSESA